MSEQQQLHASLINASQNSRAHCSPMMPVQYLGPAGPRMDGVPSNPVGNHPYYYPLFRTGEQVPSYLCRPVPPPFLYTYQQTVPEAPLSNASPEDYASLAITQQTYPTLQYSHIVQNSHPLPSLVPATHRSTGTSIAPPANTSRPKRLLEICDPVTHAAIDLQSAICGSDVPPKLPAKSSECFDTNPATSVYQSRALDVIAPTPDTFSESEEAEKPVDNTTAEIVTVLPRVLTPVEQDLDISDVVENDPSSPSNRESDVEEDTADDTGSCIDSDDGDAGATGRRMYNREFLLSCKDSPVARVALQELVVLSDYHIRKGNRGSHRTAQRVIRLPTGITIKRIEDAFIPSQLRKKKSSDDTKKTLTQDLSMILNRVSPSNLKETVDELRKLKLRTADDLKTLADSIFQKAIRQTKYSRVFALMCKELKGEPIQGSESLDILVLRQVQELFNTPLETLIAELNIVIDQKITDAKDDDLKKLFEDDRDTMIAKKTDTYYGNITLLAELYLHSLVAPKTMVECLKKLCDSTAPEAVTSLLILLKACGSLLDQHTKKSVDASFSRLSNLLKSNKLPAHQAFKVQDLCDLRSRGWKEENVPRPIASQHDTASRKVDDKLKLSSIVSSDTKRRSVQSTNPVTPSNLAVTQQPQSSRKLRPTHANWSQGSGQFNNAAEAGRAQSQQQKKPAQQTVQTVLSNRSREVSPLVGPGTLGSRENRQSNAFGSTSTSTTQSTKAVEDIQTVLERTSGLARSFVSLLSSAEEDPCTMVDACKPTDRFALLHNVFEMLMDKSSKERDAAGTLCMQLLNKEVITQHDMLSACRQYFPSCDEYWLEDYPFGWIYLSEIFQHLIQGGRDHLHLLCQMLAFLPATNEGAAVVLATCLTKSATRLNVDIVGDKFRSLNLDWCKFGVSSTLVRSFAEKHAVVFTLDTGSLESKLKTLALLMEAHASSEEITNFFRPLSTSVLPATFVRSCTSTMVAKSKGLSRQRIDDLAMGLWMLVDHNPERELQVLHGLEECSENGVPRDQWIKSLLEKKVVSNEAFRSWEKTHNGDKSITKNLPMRNP